MRSCPLSGPAPGFRGWRVRRSCSGSHPLSRRFGAAGGGADRRRTERGNRRRRPQDTFPQMNDVHPTRRETMQHRIIKLAPLALALGLAIALPAQADPAGPGCWTFNDTTGEWEQDNANATNRTEGSEHGERSEEHTSELQSLMRIPYAVFCL